MPKNKRTKTNYISPAKRTPKAAIYVRVSTHHQVDKDSLPFQRQELENYSRYALNIEDFEIFEDAGYSAKNTDRPKYQEMMSRIRQDEFTHILVWKLDRISRNLGDFTDLWEELKDKNISFISKMEQFDTSSAMGEAMLRIILVFAELERKLTAERVFSIMLSRAQKAQRNGAQIVLGYGWDENKKDLIIIEDEAKIIRQMFDKYEEVISTPLLAKWLDEQGITTKYNNKWNPRTIIYVLRNPIYKGTYRWNYRNLSYGNYKPEDEVIYVNEAVPAIISEEQWERVQKLLESNFKGTEARRKYSKNIHILSGLIRCGFCGKNYVSSLANVSKKTGFQPSRYRCSTHTHRKQCNNKALNGLKIEPFILEYIRAYVLVSKRANISFVDTFLKVLNKPEIVHVDIVDEQNTLTGTLAGMLDMETSATAEVEVNDFRVDELKKQKQKIERAISRLDDAYYFAEELETMPKKEYLIKRSEFQQKLDKIDYELSNIKTISTQNIDADIDLFSQFLLLHNLYYAEDIRKILPDLDRQVVYDFLHKIIKVIEVHNAKVTKIVFYAPHGDVCHNIIYKQ